MAEWHGLTRAEVEAEWAEVGGGYGEREPYEKPGAELTSKQWQEKRLGPGGWTRAIAEAEWAEAKAGFKGGGPLAIDIKVSGVESLAKSFETLSARAHKTLIPNVLMDSVNRLNAAIVRNIPIGTGTEFAQEERVVAAEEGISVQELRRRYPGVWREAQSEMREAVVPSRTRHTTTVGVPLPSEQELGIRSDDYYYPFAVEYGTRFQAALAPIRRTVERLEKSEFGEMMDLMGHGLAPLAMVMGPALLLRKAIFGRTTPKEFMPIEWSRSRPGDSL